jgi:hypothetical protein
MIKCDIRSMNLARAFPISVDIEERVKMSVNDFQVRVDVREERKLIILYLFVLD